MEEKLAKLILSEVSKEISTTQKSQSIDLSSNTKKYRSIGKKFFKDGERLNDEALPDWMITQEMKQAMSTLSTFSEKDQQYYQYQARQEYLREQRTIQSELELANKREEAANKREALALNEKKVALQEMNLALAEIERLKALLAQKE